MSFDDLKKILLSEKPSDLIIKNEGAIFNLIPELKSCKGFNQNNIWHVFDVYEHILHVIDNVDCSLVLRVSALFHDIGKPVVYVEDSNKVGHFPYHWIESLKIFDKYKDNFNLTILELDHIKKLILYHDININKLDEKRYNEFISDFNDKDLLKELFIIKRADLKAQNPKYHYILSEYDELEKKLQEM